MRILLFIGRLLSSFALSIAITLFIVVISFVTLLGNKQSVKETISSTDVYDDIVTVLIESAQQENDTKSISEDAQNYINFSDPEIKEIYNKNFPPAFLQAEAEKALDSMYSWLDGTANSLEFRVDLTENLSATIDDLATYTATRNSSLPECTQQQLQEQAVNIYSSDCSPPGFNSEDIYNLAISDLSGESLLSDAIVTSDNLKTESGESLEDELSALPVFYQILDNAMIPVLLLFVVVSGFYVAVRLPFVRGFESLGRRLLYRGLVPLAFAIGFRLFLPSFTESFQDKDEPSTDLLVRVGTVFIEKLDTIIIIGFGCIALLGLLIMIASHFIEKSDKHKLKSHADSSVNNTPTTVATSPYQTEIPRKD